ncbi:MAG: YdcF family protein, partial [Pirellulales bacterium]
MATAALVGGAWMFRERLLVRAAQWLDVGERPRACDYVLVLPGGEETRPFVAAAIVKTGRAKMALVPRTVLTPNTADGTDKTAHEIDCEVLSRRGIPPNDVRLIGQGSTSTYTDAQALAEFLKDRPPAVIAIVTHDFHTRRARWVFRRVLRERADDLYFVGAPHD